MIPASVLDALILKVLDELDTPSVEWETEVILRMGATRGRHASVEDAAARLGLHPSSLGRKFQGLASPGPQTLLAWGRLLAAMYAWDWRADLELLETRSRREVRLRSLGKVAISLGWPDHYVLARALNRHAGMNPTTWARKVQSLEGLVDVFLARWRANGARLRKAVHA